MAAVTESQREERIAAVLARAGAGQPGVDGVPLDTFSREYFRQVDLEDLDERAPEDLLGALLSHWQFAAQRQAGAPKVRVFSPTPGADGWASRHSVVADRQRRHALPGRLGHAGDRAPGARRCT